MCQCTPSGAEQCDGRDNDCDGLLDNGATCSQAGFTCQSGACACDAANLCGATCVDKTKDANNCGSCGNTCKAGETCQNGTCACRPGSTTVCGGICVNTKTDDKNCGGCGLTCPQGCSDGQCLVTLATGQDSPTQMTVDATSIYWTSADSGTVNKLSLDGGSLTVLASEQGNPSGMVVDATNVYWTNKLYSGDGALVLS